MATIFACPECGSTLKSAQALAAGTKIKCPKCQTIFAIPERNGADDENRPKGQAGAAGKDVAKKVGSKPPPRPQPKEEFAAYDDGDDDEVQRDDDEEEVRPKKKKKRKGKKKPLAINPALIGGIAGLVLLLTAGYVVGWVWPGFLARLGNEPLAYVPPGSTMVMSADVETLIDRLNVGPQVDQWLRQIPVESGEISPANCKKETGLEFKELFNQVTMASLTPVQDWQKGKAKTVLVVKSKVPFDRSKVAHFLGPKDQAERVKWKTVYKGKSKTGEPTTMYFPTDQIIVGTTNLTDTELEPILASRGTKPLLAPETMGLVDLVRQNQMWAVIPFDANARQKIKSLIKSAPAGAGQETKAFEAALPNAKGAGAWLAVDNNQVKLSMGLTCADADAAKKVAREAQQSWDKQTKGLVGAAQMTVIMAFVPEPLRPFAQELIASVRYTTQETTAVVSVQANLASIKSVIQAIQQAGPGLFMGGAGGMAPGMRPGAPGGFNPGVPPRGGRRPRK